MEMFMLKLPTTLNSDKMKPSIEKPPILEIKVLLQYLKYVFLGTDNTLPVILSSQLKLEQEQKLLQVLTECRRAIGWSIADI